MSDLVIRLKYDIQNDKFDITSNVKEKSIPNIVANFLRSQIGSGEDNREANKLDNYNITIELNLESDTFKVTDNCGNKGLRDGILLRFLKDYDYAI